MDIKEEINCFVMMPFGREKSEKEYWKSIFKRIIEPAVKYDNENINVFRVDLDPMSKSGNWLKSIVKSTHEADIVIADVTGLNPNVMWELGLRHASSKSGTIIISQHGTEIPSDLKNYNFIFYSEDMSDFQRLKDDINHTVRKISNNPHYVDSPWFDFESQLGVRRKDLSLKFRVGYSKCDEVSEDYINTDSTNDIELPFNGFNETEPTLTSEEYFQKYMFDKSNAEFYVESEVELYHRRLRAWSEEMEAKAKRVWESKRLKALAVPVLPVLTNDSDSYIEDIHVHLTFPRDKVILLKELPDEEAYPVKPKKPQYLLKSNVSRGLEAAMKLSDSLSYMFPTEASGPSFKMDNFILSNAKKPYWGPYIEDNQVQFQTDSLRQGWRQDRWPHLYIVPTEPCVEMEFSVEITAKSIKGKILKDAKLRVVSNSYISD